MKATCIIGSPKENGNTAYIVDKIINGLKSADIEVKRYVLGQMNIKYCKGCEYCLSTRKCIQRDDMDIIIRNIMNSDIVLVASPSYWGDISGQLKVFIDRCSPLCNADTGITPVPFGKIGISVAIRRGNSKHENQHIIDTIEHYFGHLNIKSAEKLMIESIGQLEDYNRKKNKVREAFEIGRNIKKHFID